MGFYCGLFIAVDCDKWWLYGLVGCN